MRTLQTVSTIAIESLVLQNQAVNLNTRFLDDLSDFISCGGMQEYLSRDDLSLDLQRSIKVP